MNSSNEQVIFEDNFDGKLGEGWSWLREHPDYWRLSDGGLELCVEPGVADTVRNALVRPAPDRNEGTFAIEVTVTNHTHPTQQYEQAGITWYNDGKPVFKEVKELIDGDLYIIPAEPRCQRRAFGCVYALMQTHGKPNIVPMAKPNFTYRRDGRTPPTQRRPSEHPVLQRPTR